VCTHGDAAVDIDAEVTDDRHRNHSCVTDVNRTTRNLMTTPMIRSKA